MSDWTPDPKIHRQAIIDIGFSTFSAIAGAVLRRYGHERFGEIVAKLVGLHHDRHFRDGLQKLGLDSEESDVIKSAKYHYYSNSIGGINMGYGEDEQGRGWIFYPTPWYWFDSPYSPSVGAAAIRSDVVTGFYRPWHGNNGRSLGNLRIGFMFTHQVARGDPYDAGYFFEADRDLEPHETLQTNWGETPPAIQRPVLDPVAWPHERLVKAVASYHYGYIGNALHQLISAVGTSEAAEIVEHGYRVYLFQHRGRLEEYFNVDAAAPFSVGTMLARFQTLFREEVTVTESADRVVLRQEGSNLRRFSETPLPREIEQAMTAAWAALTTYANPGVTMRQTASVAGGDPGLEWTFERS